MKQGIVAIAIIATVSWWGINASAQDIALPQLPEPVRNVFDTVQRIHIDISEFSWLKNISQWNYRSWLQNTSLEETRGELQTFWNKINDWVFHVIGVSLGEILKTIGNLFIWVFQMIIKIIQALVARL